MAVASRKAWEKILNSGGKYFKVCFKRKTAGKNGEKIGSIREMVCRISVRRYTNAVTGLGEVIPARVRRAEDRRCNVLTVFDVQKFHELRRRGLRRVMAGRGAYRRINMAEIVSLSLVKK